MVTSIIPHIIHTGFRLGLGNSLELAHITKTRLFKWKISSPKTENFQIKNSDIFHISA